MIKERPATPDIPPPGIYRDVPAEWYHGWDAISNSGMSTLKINPAYYKAKRIVKETKAMAFGTLCHTGTLEPLSIAQRYVVMPRFEDQIRQGSGEPYKKPKLTNAYEELVNTFKAANADKIVVTQDEFDTMLGVVTSLSRDERAAQALSGVPELSLVWIDPETGLLCKGRVDSTRFAERRVGDLKTTGDASRFESVIYDRGYHRQMAFYCDGLTVLTDQMWQCADIVAVETSSPFCVRCAPVGDALFNAGRKEFRELLTTLKRCRETDTWPGYEQVEVWDLPKWDKTTDTDKVELIFGDKTVTL